MLNKPEEVKNVLNDVVSDIVDHYRIGDVVIFLEDNHSVVLVDLTGRFVSEDIKEIKEKFTNRTEYDELIIKDMYGSSLRNTYEFNFYNDQDYTVISEF